MTGGMGRRGPSPIPGPRVTSSIRRLHNPSQRSMAGSRLTTAARVRAATLIAAGAVACLLVSGLLAATGPKFRRDDPLTLEPDTQDASRVQEWTIDLFVDLAMNLFGQPGDDTTGVHALNVNTIDEV